MNARSCGASRGEGGWPSVIAALGGAGVSEGSSTGASQQISVIRITRSFLLLGLTLQDSEAGERLRFLKYFEFTPRLVIVSFSLELQLRTKDIPLVYFMTFDRDKKASIMRTSALSPSSKKKKRM